MLTTSLNTKMHFKTQFRLLEERFIRSWNNRKPYPFNFQDNPNISKKAFKCMDMSFILHLVFQSSSLIKLHFLKAGQNNKIVIVAGANNKSSFHHLLSFAKLRSLKLLLCDFYMSLQNRLQCTHKNRNEPRYYFLMHQTP